MPSLPTSSPIRYTPPVRSRLARYVLILAALLGAGALGYRLVEGAGWWDAFYMAVITLTTVGYHEVFPLSVKGQAFTVAFLLVGLGVLLLAATEMARTVVEGELRQVLGRFRRSRMIERLSGHFVVCGWGRMGSAVVDELRRSGLAVAVVERSPEIASRVADLGIPVVTGDATEDATLDAAGIGRARGLVACLNDDAHNVYTVLTARSKNPALVIVARAGGAGATDRLRRAGADRVVNPYELGGRHLAHLLSNRTVIDFQEVAGAFPGQEALELGHLPVRATGPLAAGSLGESRLAERFVVSVVAVRRGAQLVPEPGGDFRPREGDVLLLLGTRKSLDALEAELGRSAGT